MFTTKNIVKHQFSGFLYDGRIDSEKLKYIMELKNIKRGRISEYVNIYPNSSFHKDKSPWAIPCHIALPCATQNELGKSDAEILLKNGCICVGEGANMPSTPEAIEVFIKNKILFAPGKASNAGGVAVSGLEWLKIHYVTVGLEKKLIKDYNLL